MIKVTEQAKQEVHKLMLVDGYDSNTDYIRVGVKSGGCSGLSYDLKFDKKANQTDKIFQDNGIKIIVDDKSFLYLIGTTYGFLVNEDITSAVSGNSASFVNVPIYEGTLATAKYTVDSNNPDKKYLITSNRADTTTLKVSVQTSATDTRLATYKLATELTDVTATSQVYFLQEEHHGEFEVYFGDNVLGQGLVDGNIVIL
ncbi:MAG: hypothetical protein CMC53_04555, partial [Flavobacteriaceae bacterium]|nr:hypothetical protein [Flavobacteriaceae bacterium]